MANNALHMVANMHANHLVVKEYAVLPALTATTFKLKNNKQDLITFSDTHDTPINITLPNADFNFNTLKDDVTNIGMFMIELSKSDGFRHKEWSDLTSDNQKMKNQCAEMSLMIKSLSESNKQLVKQVGDLVADNDKIKSQHDELQTGVTNINICIADLQTNNQLMAKNFESCINRQNQIDHDVQNHYHLVRLQELTGLDNTKAIRDINAKISEMNTNNKTLTDTLNNHVKFVSELFDSSTNHDQLLTIYKNQYADVVKMTECLASDLSVIKDNISLLNVTLSSS